MKRSEVTSNQVESSFQSDAGFADELSCPICLEFFQNPVQLPCLHNFCQDCLQIEFQHNQNQSLPFICPTCRCVVPLREDGIKDLPKSFYLSNIVEKYKKLHEGRKCEDQKRSLASSVEGSAVVNRTSSLDHKHTCTEHSKPLTLFCSTCIEVMCTKCVSKHRTHDFEDIDEKYEKNLGELQSLMIPGLTEVRGLLMSKRKAIDATVHSIKCDHIKSWQVVADKIEALKELLNQKQKELETEWQEQEDKVLSSATKKQKQMETMLYNVAELQVQAQELTEANPICFVLDFKKVKDRFKDVTSFSSVDIELQTSNTPGLTAGSEFLESLKGVKEKILDLHLHENPVLSSSKTGFDTVQISEKNTRKVSIPHQYKQSTKVPEKPSVVENASKSQQFRTIKNQKQEALCEGDVVYLVEYKWYSNWKAYVTSKTGNGDNPGPIDNSLLLNEANELLPYLVEDEDFIALPEEAWDCLVTWYGYMTGQEPIKCSVIMQGLINKKPCLELYPLKLHLSKYQQGLKTETIQRIFSESGTLQFLKRQVIDLFHLKSSQKFQLFVSTNLECEATWMNLSSMSDSCSLQDAGITHGSNIIVQL